MPDALEFFEVDLWPLAEREEGVGDDADDDHGLLSGGDTDDVSYSALFGSSVQSLYQQAASAGAN